MRLTKGQRRILEFLNAQNEDSELVYEKGAGWWMGDDRIHGCGPTFLIHACLIRPSEDSRIGHFERWRINSDGIEALNDPKFIPPIYAHMKLRCKDVLRMTTYGKGKKK